MLKSLYGLWVLGVSVQGAAITPRQRSSSQSTADATAPSATAQALPLDLLPDLDSSLGSLLPIDVLPVVESILEEVLKVLPIVESSLGQLPAAAAAAPSQGLGLPLNNIIKKWQYDPSVPYNSGSWNQQRPQPFSLSPWNTPDMNGLLPFNNPSPTSMMPYNPPYQTTFSTALSQQSTSAVPTAAPFSTPSQLRQSTSAVATAPPLSTPSQPPATGSADYMDIVNEWRAKLSLPSLTQSSKLEANALKTVNDDKGQMKHELNPGSMAQVLAPGDANGFEKIFVGGWLCEMPDLPGLDGICTTMSKGWAYNGETGHAEILTSPAYHNIGCALAYGIWGCDLS